MHRLLQQAAERESTTVASSLSTDESETLRGKASIHMTACLLA